MIISCLCKLFFFFNDTATTEIYTLSLHDALPISLTKSAKWERKPARGASTAGPPEFAGADPSKLSLEMFFDEAETDRKSTRLNSSHANISYAVFCLKKKN